VAAAEDRPDGTPDDPDLWAAIEASGRRERDWTEDERFFAVKFLGRSSYKYGQLESAAIVAQKAAYRARQAGGAAAEEAARAGLVRDVFGDPFRPAAFDPGWRTPDAAGPAGGGPPRGRAAARLTCRVPSARPWPAARPS
jgi:hypothetical protein